MARGRYDTRAGCKGRCSDAIRHNGWLYLLPGVFVFLPLPHGPHRVEHGLCPYFCHVAARFLPILGLLVVRWYGPEKD